MRTGLAQMNIVWENVQKNRERAERFFRRAAEKKVDLLVFPEMTLTGFSMQVEKTAASWQEQVGFFEEMSRKYGVAAVFGYAMPVAERDRDVHPDWKPYHNHLAVAENGRIRMNYIKIHPFTYGQEGESFQGGEQIVCMKWKDTVLGAFICYDLRFPEIFQISSRKSEVIFVIANWPKSRIDQWEALLRARAIENQCFIVGVNRTGEGGGIAYNGHSAVYDPAGERLTEMCEEEQLLICDMDTEEVRRGRERFPLKNDRRPELYRRISLLSV